MSGLRIIGTVFKKRGEEGDFNWMIRSGKYNCYRGVPKLSPPLGLTFGI
jgi:hypothetical protein